MINNPFPRGLWGNASTAKLMVKLQPGDVQDGSFSKALWATLKAYLQA